MEENKKSFILYVEQSEVINELSDSDAGKLFKAVYQYANDGIIPKLEGAVKIAFIPIRQQIDRNTEKYTAVKEKRKQAGSKGGKQKVANLANATFARKFVANVADNVNDNVNDNENDNENVNVNENVNENFNVVEETTSPPAESLLQNWYGEYQNVHLTEEQYNLLKCNVVGDKKVLDGLIDELSSNIAQKNPKAPPYDEEYPDMHFSKIKAYWNYRKLHGFKPPDTKEDKAQKFKDELAALTEKYRAKELDSG